MIEQDVEQSKLNLEAITIQQEQDPLSRNGKTFHLDRIHDLEAVLRDIRTRPQLELIEQETKVFDLKHTPNLFPFGYDAFNRNLSSFDYERLNRKDYGFAIPSEYKIGPGDLLEVGFTVKKNPSIHFPSVVMESFSCPESALLMCLRKGILSNL